MGPNSLSVIEEQIYAEEKLLSMRAAGSRM